MFTATSEKSIGARFWSTSRIWMQRPAVLAAGQADHDAIAVLDQTVLGDRLGDLLGDPRFERRLGHGIGIESSDIADF